MARPDLTQTGAGLVSKVLADPSLFPDEFKAWIPRWVQQNVNFQLQQSQLPAVEANKLVGATGNAAFTGAWANLGGSNEPANYYRDPFHRVHIGGIVSAGVIGTEIFLLPAGYRPQYALVIAVPSNGAFGIVTINPSGSIVASAGNNTYFSLSGISFRQFA